MEGADGRSRPATSRRSNGQRIRSNGVEVDWRAAVSRQCNGHQQPYGRGEGGGRGAGGYPQQPLGRREGAAPGRGGVGPAPVRSAPAAPRPVAPVAVSAAAASTPARPPAPAASGPAPAPPAPAAAVAATALARGMGRLAVAGAHPAAPPAPAAARSAPAQQPAAAPPVSSKGIPHPARPGFGKLGRRVVVRANHFLVEVADNDICHYNVSISPEPKARRINRVVLSELIKAHGETSLAHKMPAYDGSMSMYTAGELPFKSMDFVVKLGRREIEYKVTIRYAARANLYHLQQFLNGQQRDSPHDTIQALDVVMRESPSLNYVTVSRSFFSKQFGAARDIGDGLECWRGYYQSLRPTQMGLSLNIDTCSTSFYKSIPAVQFVKEFLLVTNPRQPFSDRDRLKIKKALRGVRVETTHQQGKKSIYKITGITSVPLEQLSFPCNDGTQLTVVQYFEQRYKYRLQYTAWPCLQSGNDSKPIYLPMEVCQIIEGQKYSRKLSDTQVTSILKATCKRPQERENNIIQMVGHNNYSADRLAQVFGITVTNQMANVQARVLPPPLLKYHESGREKTVAPSIGQWNMINKKMVNGGTVNSWTCLSFSRMPRHVVDRICDDLVQMCNSIGMVFNRKPVIEVQSASPNHIEAALRDVHTRAPNLQLLIVILPDVSSHYGKIKRLCETKLDIVSQCIHPKPNKNKQYFENVALKINVKVGGRNTVLERAFEPSGIPFVSDVPTIIFGADVTHPVAGEDSSASVAAVVASMDWPQVTTYKALVSAQAHRQEIIQNLFWTATDPEKGTPVNGGMIRELLSSFYKRTGRKPERIIFYRDGVSEGQFSHVLLHEMDAIRKACASMQRDYLPPVTFVIVQKRHHTRLFPEVHGRRDLTDKSGNILPGTVVDSSICHPNEFDFYLCSHAGIQGTSRPAHYHVLYDENHFSADALQMLTNNLCYTYARCTRSVSVVPPAYYAHLAAFRARYYDEQAEGTDGASVVSGGPAALRRLPQVKDKVKEVMFFC
ncbi:protein argonaute MEL1-like [Panicum virgatum]|nr:protein argonaute MEL1-like [Panicum virgatum]